MLYIAVNGGNEHFILPSAQFALSITRHRHPDPARARPASGWNVYVRSYRRSVHHYNCLPAPTACVDAIPVNLLTGELFLASIARTAHKDAVSCDDTFDAILKAESYPHTVIERSSRQSLQELISKTPMVLSFRTSLVFLPRQRNEESEKTALRSDSSPSTCPDKKRLDSLGVGMTVVCIFGMVLTPNHGE